jgi:hypothetical protein
MTRKGQAVTQAPQPVHESLFTWIVPSVSLQMASAGQAAKHSG